MRGPSSSPLHSTSPPIPRTAACQKATATGCHFRYLPPRKSRAGQAQARARSAPPANRSPRPIPGAKPLHRRARGPPMHTRKRRAAHTANPRANRPLPTRPAASTGRVEPTSHPRLFDTAHRRLRPHPRPARWRLR